MSKDVSLFDDDEAVIAEGYFIRWEIVIFILAAFFTIVALVVAVEEETPAPLLVPLLLFLWGWLVMKFSKRTLLVTNYRICATAFLGWLCKGYLIGLDHSGGEQQLVEDADDLDKRRYGYHRRCQQRRRSSGSDHRAYHGAGSDAFLRALP